MGVKFNDKLFIKIPTSLKEEAEKRAEDKGLTLSSYIRDLINNDLKKKKV